MRKAQDWKNQLMLPVHQKSKPIAIATQSQHTTKFIISYLQTHVRLIYIITGIYCSIPGKRPLLGKRPCTEFQGVNVAASIQMYGNYILGKCPCGLPYEITFHTRSFSIMVRCWALNPEDRPTFKQLNTTMDELLQTAEGYAEFNMSLQQPTGALHNHPDPR